MGFSPISLAEALQNHALTSDKNKSQNRCSSKRNVKKDQAGLQTRATTKNLDFTRVQEGKCILITHQRGIITNLIRNNKKIN